MALLGGAGKAAEPQPPGSSAQDLPTWQKATILFIVSWNCFVVTSTSTSLFVATPEIAASFRSTVETINVTNAPVLIAMGCSTLIWAPLAEIFSRRLSYNIALAVMFATSVGTALAPNVSAFTAMRILTGLTGTYFMVAGQTIIADMFVSVVRGRAVGCMMAGSVAGTALGPCLAGIITTYNHWRTIYWLQAAQSGLGFVLSLLFITSQLSEKATDSRLSPLGVLQKFNPTKLLRLYLRREVLLADLACGLLGVVQYGLLASVRHIINPRFNLTTPLISGLFYLSPGLGFVVGSLVGGHYSDRTVKRWIAMRNGRHLPRDRLNSGAVYFFLVLPISILLYGWGLQKNFGGLALIIIMAFWIGIGLMGAWNGLNTYTAEVLPEKRSEVVCSKYVVQYSFAAAATGMIVPLLNAIGAGWSFTICVYLLLTHKTFQWLTRSLVVGGNILGGLMVVYVARTNLGDSKEEHTELEGQTS